MGRASRALGKRACLAGLLGLIAASMAVPAVSVEEPKPPPSQPISELVQHATRVMERLQAGRYEAILDEMHYPPEYTKDQLAVDRRALAAGLAFVMSELGRLESFQPQMQRVEFYVIGIAMGTTEYWSKLPQKGVVAGYTFETRHAKLESGLVQITYTRTGGRTQIRALEIGVPAAAPGARALIERIGPAMLERMKAASGDPGKGGAAD